MQAGALLLSAACCTASQSWSFGSCSAVRLCSCSQPACSDWTSSLCSGRLSHAAVGQLAEGLLSTCLLHCSCCCGLNNTSQTPTGLPLPLKSSALGGAEGRTHSPCQSLFRPAAEPAAVCSCCESSRVCPHSVSYRWWQYERNLAPAGAAEHLSRPRLIVCRKRRSILAVLQVQKGW